MAKTSLTIPYKFAGETKAVANEVNADFEAVEIFSNGVNAELADLRKALTELQRKPTREMFDVYFNFSGISPVGAYPLWTGETITNCRTIYPDFWKEALRLKNSGALRTGTMTEYEKELEDFGESGMFMIDELNGHIRLPKILHFISSVSELSEKGTTHADSQQKVKGSFWTMNWHESYASQAEGDFQISDQYMASIRTGDGGRWLGKKVSLDSSRNSRVGNYVQPRHVKLCLYLQVANNTADISLMDTNIIATRLAEAIAALESLSSGMLENLKTKEEEINTSILATTGSFNETADEKLAALSSLVETTLENSLNAENQANAAANSALSAQNDAATATDSAQKTKMAEIQVQACAEQLQTYKEQVAQNAAIAGEKAAAAETSAEEAKQWAQLNNGILVYCAETVYAKGDWVKGYIDGSFALYESQQDSNCGKALTDVLYWKRVTVEDGTTLSGNVSNCITRIPQDILLELKNNILTLKAGSRLYLPNVLTDNNTEPTFTEVMTEEDVSLSDWAQMAGGGACLFYNTVTSSLVVYQYNDIYSDTSTASTSQKRVWYDVAHNQIKYTTNGGSSWQTGLCLPLASISWKSGEPAEILKLFNGVGFIGSVVYVLPGVRGLIPNGRKRDGSLESRLWENEKVRISGDCARTMKDSYFINETGIIRTYTCDCYRVGGREPFSKGSSLMYWYDTQNNFVHSFSYNNGVKINESSGWLHFADAFYNIRGICTRLVAKNVHCSFDSSEKSLISGLMMPSTRFIDITLGASGSAYVCPANGYVFAIAPANSDACRLGIFYNNWDDNIGICYGGRNGTVLRSFLPVRSGQEFKIFYGNVSSVTAWFFYTEGEN